MKLTYQLPVVAALTLAGVVLAEPVAEGAVAPVAVPVAGEVALTDAQVIKLAAELGEEGIACLKGMTETLQGVHDLAGADAAAEKLAAHLATYVGLREKAESLQKAMGEVDEAIEKAFDAEMESRGITQKDWDAVEKELKLAYLKLRDMEPPFYGSEKLQAVVGELHRINPYRFPEEAEQRVTLDDMLAGIPEELVHQAEAALDQLRASADKHLEIMKGVKDKETADAAVEQLEALFQERRKLLAEIADSEYSSAFFIMLKMEAMGRSIEQNGAELDRIMSAEPPFYGSVKLKEYVIGDEADDEEDADAEDDDVESTVTEEQMQKAQAMLEAYIELGLELARILEGVTDKESADAAAPKTAVLVKQMDAIVNQAIEDGLTRACGLVANKLSLDDRTNALWQQECRLSEQDFYGSNALMEALCQGVDED